MCLGTIRIGQYPSNTNYLLFIFRLPTFLDPTGSSSGLHCKPIMFRKLRTLL
jgi:hypothetical protein